MPFSFPKTASGFIQASNVHYSVFNTGFTQLQSVQTIRLLWSHHGLEQQSLTPISSGCCVSPGKADKVVAPLQNRAAGVWKRALR